MATKASIQQANSAARQAQAVVRQDARDQQRAVLQAVVRQLLSEARPLFDRFPRQEDDGARRWSIAGARRMGLFHALQPMVNRAVHRAANGMVAVVTDGRRRAYLTAVNATAIGLAHAGVEPQLADAPGTLLSTPPSIRLQVMGREVEIVEPGAWREAFDPSEARDEDGKWTAGGASEHPLLSDAALKVNRPRTDEAIAENHRIHKEAMARLEGLCAGVRVAPGGDRFAIPDRHEIAPADKVALVQVTEQMTTYAIAKLVENAQAISFYDSAEALDRSVVLSSTSSPASRLGGAWIWVRSDPGNVGTLHIRTDEPNTHMGVREILEHEIGHAIDGHAAYSSKPAWQEVWRNELMGKLTEHADKNFSEGFAEFHRLMVSQRRYARDEFPKAYALMREWGFA